MKYVDINGKKRNTDTGQDRFLRLMYSTPVGRALLRPLVHPLISKLAGNFLNSSFSCHLIKPFIRSNQIDMSDYEDTTYSCYNDFFTRKIKPGARTLAGDIETLISPCDSYVTAYHLSKNSILTIKHTKYSLASLLHSRNLAKRFEGGYALILRLTVSDYHRYCYPVTGKQSKNYFIPGKLHTVNPVANDFFPIYKENSREYTIIHSECFGDVLQMEVGALLVGKIVNQKECCPVIRGEEKGYFEFGGSTIVLLLQKDTTTLRPDLLKNTREGYETQIRLGDRIGTAKTPFPGDL